MLANQLYDYQNRLTQAIVEKEMKQYNQQGQNWFDKAQLKKALLKQALFNRYMLTIILMTFTGSIFLLFFNQQSFLLTLFLIGTLNVIGLVGGGWLFYLTITDPKQHAAIISQFLESRFSFNIAYIQDENLQARLCKALEYWGLINDLFNKMQPGILQSHLQQTERAITNWLQTVYTLAQRIDHSQLQLLTTTNWPTIQETIKLLETQLAGETSPKVKQHLQQTIYHWQQQHQAMQLIFNRLKETYSQLDQTISALGVIHSKLLLIQTSPRRREQLESLQTDVSDEIYHLQDLVQAMNDLY